MNSYRGDYAEFRKRAVPEDDPSDRLLRICPDCDAVYHAEEGCSLCGYSGNPITQRERERAGALEADAYEYIYGSD